VKTLFLLRHAKSRWKDESLADVDRPLSRRGRDAAARLAEHLRKNFIRPALLLCSPAERTTETLDRIRGALTDETTIRLDRGIYLASPETLLKLLRRVDDAHPSVMVIGHNPGLERLAHALASNTTDAPYHRMTAKFPTGALATLSLTIDRWKAIEPGCGTLDAFTTPKDLTHEPGT
jgi:phosphohistidine phosphatase